MYSHTWHFNPPCKDFNPKIDGKSTSMQKMSVVCSSFTLFLLTKTKVSDHSTNSAHELLHRWTTFKPCDRSLWVKSRNYIIASVQLGKSDPVAGVMGAPRGFRSREKRCVHELILANGAIDITCRLSILCWIYMNILVLNLWQRWTSQTGSRAQTRSLGQYWDRV